jgi:two-component system sensor histidine kinase PilS (NtrC family)
VKNTAGPAPRPERTLPADEPAPPDRAPVDGDDAPWRTLEYFATTRVLVASALVLGAAAFGFRAAGTTTALQSALVLSLGYFLAAAAFAGLALYVHRHFAPQVFGQLALDLTAVTMLVVASGGVASGWVILYLLPLAGASLLLPSLQVFFVCAVAVLAILVDAALRTFTIDGGDSLLFQAGIFGAALFAVSALLRALSARLASQEALARSRGRDLQNQLAINRLVIAQMEQGVIVVDRGGRVRANNRAARRMLGLGPATQLTGEPLGDIAGAGELASAFLVWSEGGRSEGLWSNTIVPTTADGAPAQPEARLRARFARPSAPGSDEFVIFIEDVRDVEDRAQQLKLAAMGRLTASIAHEIRNPLAAISNAGQLLNEDARDPVLKRLAVIVRENTQRLNRLVEDVLRVARREPPLGDEIALDVFVRDFLAEFARDRGLPAATIAAQFSPDQRVKFEQSHLRQVLYNLVDNALRYATGAPGSVLVVVEPGPEGNRPQLWVLDDGPGVPFEARSALFEPFFTTRNQGTGLGLYLAREFCVTNRAELAYAARREVDGTSRDGFLLRFGQGSHADASLHGFLDTIPVR